MGPINSVPPVLLFFAAFASNEKSLDWAHRRAESEFGPIELVGGPFRFDRFTGYYAEAMGNILFKRLWGFRRPIDPATLPDIKRLANDWEAEYATTGSESVVRPLNLDPGYVDLGKLILASTKNHAHRIYLRDGIFAETTLIYTKKQWMPLPWTYPDYQSPEYHEFLNRCREFLRATRPIASEVDTANGRAFARIS